MFQPGDFVHTIGDAHVYVNHVEPLKEQVLIICYIKVWSKLAQWFLRRRLKCEKLTTDKT
jgi:thymidylate synthase